MTYIMGKNREDIIKTLKKLGEIVILAKAEIIYAFKPHFFPRHTTEEVMEEIKKQPEAYEYYRAGLIKITEIEEVGEKSVIGTPRQVINDTINHHENGVDDSLTDSKPEFNISDCMGTCLTCKEKVKDKCPLNLNNIRLEEEKSLPNIVGTGSVNDQDEFNRGVK